MSERGFDALLHVYEAGLKIVLRHQFITLMVMFGTIALTGYLYVIIPKGFFPQQDTGLIIAQSEAAQDISYQAMLERQQALQDALMRDPAVDTVGSAVGAGGGVYTMNDGRAYIQLKPADQRDPIGKVIARLRTNLAKIQANSNTGQHYSLRRSRLSPASPTSPPISSMPARCSTSPSSVMLPLAMA